MLARILYTLSFLLFFYSVANAQIGNFLKNKLEKAVKEKVSESVDKKRAALDTSNFNYAIAFLDKSESYANQELGDRLVKNADVLMGDDEKTPLEEARELMDFGEFNYVRRSFKLAEFYLLAAKLAFEEQGATTDVNYFRTLANLGLLYEQMGRYTQAQEYTDRALQLRQEHMGEQSAAYIASLNNKAVLTLNLGKYNEAETLSKKAEELLQSNSDTKEMPYAIVLNNRAVLSQTMGRYEQAIALMDDVLATAEKSLGEKDGTLLQLMTNKALMLQDFGRYDEAEATYLKAIDLQERRLKLNRKADPDYAHMLNNLASLYLITGQEDKVEDLLKRSLEIYENKYGKYHPVTADAESDLGKYYRFQGAYDKAKPLLESAFNTRFDKLSAKHPATVESKEELAVLYWKMGDIQEAKGLYDQVMEQTINFINDYFQPLSEAEKTNYWEKIKPRFFRFYNFAFEHYTEYPALLEKVFNYRILTKGLLLNSTTKVKNTILTSGDESLVSLYKTWVDQKQSLAAYYSLSKEALNEQRVNLDSLENAANDSERRLSQLSADFAKGFLSEEVKWEDVKASLSPNEQLMEIVQYPSFDRKLNDDTHYAALIIDKQSVKPVVKIIKNGNQLDKRYYSYYKNVMRQKMDDQYSYAQYWQPFVSALNEQATIYVVPDGVYHQINLNTLQKPDGSYLLSHYQFRLIGNPKDVQTLKSSNTFKKSAFLIGYPEYGSSAISTLPGTKVEVEKVGQTLKAQRFKVDRLMQQEASEKNIKQASSPGILHVATHGYFLEDEKLGEGAVFGVQVEHARNNPLLRSGLMLADAGKVEDATVSGTFDAQNNGVFTAYEAINMDLQQTQLVVLSACETGQGDIKSGEGVYGLQRAFKVAGAKSLIMSLWKVDDAATQQLMTSFYSNWIGGENIAKAFHNAQVALQAKYNHPYYWGAFVLVN